MAGITEIFGTTNAELAYHQAALAARRDPLQQKLHKAATTTRAYFFVWFVAMVIALNVASATEGEAAGSGAAAGSEDSLTSLDWVFFACAVVWLFSFLKWRNARRVKKEAGREIAALEVEIGNVASRQAGQDATERYIAQMEEHVERSGTRQAHQDGQSTRAETALFGGDLSAYGVALISQTHNSLVFTVEADETKVVRSFTVLRAVLEDLGFATDAVLARMAKTRVDGPHSAESSQATLHWMAEPDGDGLNVIFGRK